MVCRASRLSHDGHLVRECRLLDIAVVNRRPVKSRAKKLGGIQ